jgi:uncharacterized DUF497 family protein
MHFEYDPKKSQSNKEKHGIDFEEVQRLWGGAVKEIPPVHRGEPRYIDQMLTKTILTKPSKSTNKTG